MKNLIYSLLLLIFLQGANIYAQGILTGRVLDDKKEPLINAAVQVFSGGTQKGGCITDYDGNYVIKPLDVGYYDIVVIYQGYDSVIQKSVLVTIDSPTVFNCQMKRRYLGNIIIRPSCGGGRRPIFNREREIRKEDIANYPLLQLISGKFGLVELNSLPSHKPLQPVSNSTIAALYQRIQEEKNSYKLDFDNASKRTYDREEIRRMPY